MDFCQLKRSLTDERCGLYFLAGLDTTGVVGPGVLTVHAAEGTVRAEHEYFIASTVAAINPGLDVRIRLHSTRDLYAPDSLEDFARLFEHDHIVADPTGAFARVSKLLMLARLIRTELGSTIGRIFWQADLSTLVVMISPSAGAPNSGHLETSVDLSDAMNSLIENQACVELRRVINSVRLCGSVPSGRYIPVDTASFVPPAKTPKVTEHKRRTARALLARISGTAALIGLGTFSSASAAPFPVVEDGQLPGIAGLVGLTTLGENSYGLRNRYQAIGGLRLYFGDTGILTGAAFTPGTLCANDCQPSLDEPARVGPQRSGPTWPKPSRVAYGT